MRRASLQTPERFRSLAQLLAGEVAIRQAHDDEDEGQDDEVEARERVSDELELAREVRLFHARIVEAVEAAVETLVGDIAADVLGRELLLAPCDIEAIVDRALARFASEQPLRVRVHAQDAAGLKCAVPLIVDERLRSGDAIIELRDGAVDASLGMRLATIVQAMR